MQPLESKIDPILHNEDINSLSSFSLSEVGSLYFGPNPSSEAQRLLEQAKDLLRENERIQNEKKIILQDEAELRSRKVNLNSETSTDNVLYPSSELHRLLGETMTLSEEGKQIDLRKAQLQLYYKELKRRKEFLQNAIKIYEESELAQRHSFSSQSNELNIRSVEFDIQH